jgi:meiotically up-regulated gene 157 (Mug157) protein
MPAISTILISEMMSGQGLTSSDINERASVLRQLLLMQCGNGLMHESVSAADPGSCTRPWFEWANAMFVVLTGVSFLEESQEISCFHS